MGIAEVHEDRSTAEELKIRRGKKRIVKSNSGGMVEVARGEEGVRGGPARLTGQLAAWLYLFKAAIPGSYAQARAAYHNGYHRASIGEC